MFCFIAASRSTDKMYMSRIFTGGPDVRLDVKDAMEAAEESAVYLTILEGFVMVVSSEGDMMFLSDNVSRYLGLTQVDAHPVHQTQLVQYTSI